MFDCCPCSGPGKLASGHEMSTTPPAAAASAFSALGWVDVRVPTLFLIALASKHIDTTYFGA